VIQRINNFLGVTLQFVLRKPRAKNGYPTSANYLINQLLQLIQPKSMMHKVKSQFSVKHRTWHKDYVVTYMEESFQSHYIN
jgi:hypothetical protein